MAPSRISWATAAALLALVLAPLSPAAGAAEAATGPAARPLAAAPPSSTSVATGAATHGDRHDSHAFGDDAVLPAAPFAARARVRKWPGTKIRYYESIPAKWDWSLARAVAHWNGSGGAIKLVKVARPGRAQLMIRYGDTGGADGVGTLGYQSHNYVHLSPAYKRADEHNPQTRVWVGRLFAHEIGHVLGFDHTTGDQCALMYPVYDFGACPPLSYDKPGYYHCRWIDKPLLTRFVRWYGGRARRPAALCLIEPLPSPLSGVVFSGGNAAGGPVRVSWDPLVRPRAGTTIVVEAWPGACSTRPDRPAERVVLAATATSWKDPGYDDHRYCYSVHPVNRYGGERPPTRKDLLRYAPVPAAPALTGPVWDAGEGGHRFGWKPPYEGAYLAVVRNREAPTTCRTEHDDSSSGANQHATLAGQWVVHAEAPRECLSFFVVTPWRTVSPRTEVQVEAPTPDAPAVSAVTYDPEMSAWQVTWDAPAGTTLQVVRDSELDEACPTAFPAEPGGAENAWSYDELTWYVSMHRPEECLTFFAVASSGAVSPGTSREASVPAPDTAPTVGEPVRQPDGAVTLRATAPTGLHVRIEVVPGACTSAPPADAGWWDGQQGWDDPGLWHLYGETSDPQHCAWVAAFDQWGRRGPAEARAFSVG